MRDGLEASTVTPGRTPPEASFTTPAMLPLSAVCAPAAAGDSITQQTNRILRIRSAVMVSSSLLSSRGTNVRPSAKVTFTPVAEFRLARSVV
jgi:hypothetical protein